MSNSRINFFIPVIFFASLLVGCGEDTILTSTSIEEQIALDSAAMAGYISGRGLDPGKLDTTDAGVIYFVADEGNGGDIEYNDLVYLYLSVKLLDGSLIRTNIDTVLRNFDEELYDSTATYNPFIITHTQNGWAISPPEYDLLGMKGFIGLREGMSAVLSEINVGGRGVFITPSVYAIQNSLYSGFANSFGSSLAREPFVFEIYPTRVKR